MRIASIRESWYYRGVGGVEQFVSDGAEVRKRRKRMIITVFLIAVGLHLVGGGVATVIIVARYIFPPPATFEMRKEIRVPAKEREHKMNMQTFDSLAPKPSFNDRMLSARPTAFALPDLPKATFDQPVPIDPSTIASDQMSSLVGQAGVGAGGGVSSGFSFLGMQSSGKRILFLFDVSSSVTNKAAKSGMPLDKIKEETINFIDKLPSSTRFGIIQFTQNYKIFQNELIPANDTNRQIVRTWVESEWVETGTMSASSKVTSNPAGFLGVLKRAAEMQPDVIFVVSDASFQFRRNDKLADIPWKEIRDATKVFSDSSPKIPINFIGFQVKPSDRSEMMRVTGPTSGKLREIK